MLAYVVGGKRHVKDKSVKKKKKKFSHLTCVRDSRVLACDILRVVKSCELMRKVILLRPQFIRCTNDVLTSDKQKKITKERKKMNIGISY